MKSKPATKAAYQLLHDGSVALAQVEANGFRIDTEYLDKALRRTEKRITKLSAALREDEVYAIWRRRYGNRLSLDSKTQLADVIFKQMKYEARDFTETGRDKADKSAFEHVDLPFIEKYFERAALTKLYGTYLQGIHREVTNGYLHGSFNLNTAITYRSSATDPNLQNMPIRDPAAGELIRRCFIPRDGHVIVEVDEGGIEVRVAACYHKDPVMMSYIEDETKDMHRDMAAQCFMLKPSQVSKQARYCGKNQFVFPQFYGDYYIDCARAMWESLFKKDADGSPLVRVEGTARSVLDHLKKKGITKLGSATRRNNESPTPGTFQKHVSEVENDFWNNRFRQYGQWRREWFDRYVKTGGFTTLTGFRFEGVFRRNAVINYPVQGSAFHILLWSLVQLQKWLTKNKMRSKIVCQIHDSLVLDVYEPELQDVLAKASYLMTDGVRKHWPWIITPLAVEAEACGLGQTWHDKKPITIAKGL